jgi:3-oxoacyl-[acyl-carrier protein] reductase
MQLELAGKGVIVSGGSRGIGRAIAHAFAAEGCHVAICARGAEDLQRTEAELRERGSKVYAQTCDVSDPAALDAFLEAARSGLGRIDVLVNNASGFGASDDESGWRAGFDVDVMASVRATWKVVPWLEETGGGSIVHISSTSGLEAGSPPAYAAFKAALISHSKTIAIELAPKNIRVNCVAPGSIEFPGGMWDRLKQEEPERYTAILGSIPFGRLGAAREVANAVVFLASGAASWITGVTLSVDGGQHKGNL